MPALPAEPNKIDGKCGCGADVWAGEGFFIRKIRQFQCRRCRDADVARVAREEAKLAEPKPEPVEDDRIKVRVYYNDKVQRMIVTLVDVSRTILDTVKGLCETHGFTYSSDLGGWNGPVGSLPELVEVIGKARIRVEVSDKAAQALLMKADQNKKAVAGAGVRLANVGRRGKKLKEFQKVGVQFIAPKTTCLLADDGGLGKSAQILCAAGPKPRMMVIAPKIMVGALVKGKPLGGWADEAAMWRPDIAKITIIRKRDEFRWPEENELVLLNYELMPISPDELAREATKSAAARRAALARGEKPEDLPVKKHKIADEPPEGVELVVDEAHALANPNSQRTKRFKHLKNQVLKRGGKIRGVTATPMKNNAKELYSVLDAIGAAQIAFGSFEAYAKLHDYKPRQVSKTSVVWEFNDPSPEVAERLKRVMLRRKKRDVLTELPPLSFRRLVVDVDREALKLCDAAMKEIEASGLDLEQAMELVDESRSGVIDFTKISAALAALAKVKAPYALERADEFERTGTPVVFFAAHLSVVEMLGKRKGWGALVGGDKATANFDGEPVSMKGPEVAKCFQSGRLDNITATIQYAGVGITLTRAANAFLVEKLFNPAMNSQAIWRIERIGQENPMVVTDLVADHPLDIRMSEILEKKIELYSATVDAAAVAPEDLDKREDVVTGFVEAAKKTAPKRST